MLTNILLKCKLAGDQDVSYILDFSNEQLIAPGKGNEHQCSGGLKRQQKHQDARKTILLGQLTLLHCLNHYH